MDYKFKSTFTASAKISAPTESDRFIAKASLEPLRKILPADVNPADSPDLLFFSSNGAVAGLCNKNGDAVSNATALAIHGTAKNKYVSTDHDREKVVGVILYPALTRFGSNEPLTMEEAATLQEPFNMAVAGAIWTVINPMLVKYLNNTVGTDEDALSLSWEIAFNSYDIGVGSRNLFDAKIISADDSSFSSYEKYLRANGGEGKDPTGKEVFRIINGNAIILGYSIVPKPAAEVKGIMTFAKSDEPKEAQVEQPANNLNEIPESQRAFLEKEGYSGLGYHICDVTMDDGKIYEAVAITNCRFAPKEIDASKIVSIQISQKNIEKNINRSDARVNLNTEKTMKISNIQELETAIAKFEGAAAVVDFVKAIQQGSEDYIKNLAAKDDLVKNAEAAKLENEKRAKELETTLAQVKDELAALRAQAEADAAATKFQERMAAFDEEFDLDDEDRKLIASDVKELTDEGFASYMAKAKKLMCGKAKKQKSDGEGAQGGKKDGEKKGDKKNDKEKDDDADDSKASDETDEEKKKLKDAFASVEGDKTEKVIPQDTVIVDKSLKDQMAEAFADTIKINGKKLETSTPAKK